jgi:predicted Rossmann fold flavoprotein
LDCFDTIVIGAGAAGFFSAIEAAKRKQKVLLLDHSSKIGEKIRISGGGRCNFTNLGANYDNYISQNPNFCRSALTQFGPEDFIKLVNKYKIKFHEKKLGQLFCDDSSQQIIDMLLAEASSVGLKLHVPYSCKKIFYKPELQYKFLLDEFACSKSLIIATGGLSIPKIGASDFGYRIARQFGLNIVETKPALVPFVINDENVRSLTGISFDSIALVKKQSFRENILFTHKGVSGPAILQISSYWNDGDKVCLNFSPGLDIYQELKQVKESKESRKKQKLKNILKDIEYSSDLDLKNKILRNNIFPDKFIEFLESQFDLENILAESSDKELKELAQKINNFDFIPCGTEGYAKAEVTRGGVDTKELDSKTMEVKKIPGLFFVGEVVDVTGWLGGYNFQWAWSSGYVAGNSC